MSDALCSYISAVSGNCRLRAVWMIVNAKDSEFWFVCNRHRNKFNGRAVPVDRRKGE